MTARSARVAPPPQAPDTMTPAQLGRRARVLDAVIELVSAGRLDDMGMKDVAARSGVALGTIYRYFSSKDHVAAAALAEWARRLDGRRGRPAVEPAAGPQPMTDGLVAILRRAVGAYQRQPEFARLLIMAATSNDPFASECYHQMGRGVYGTLGGALVGLDPEDRTRVLAVVGPVWYQALIEWVNDRKTIDQVYDAVEDAARLVMAGFEPPA